MHGDFRRKQAQWKVKSHFVIGQAMLSAFITGKNFNYIKKFNAMSIFAYSLKK